MSTIHTSNDARACLFIYMLSVVLSTCDLQLHNTVKSSCTCIQRNLYFHHKITSRKYCYMEFGCVQNLSRRSRAFFNKSEATEQLDSERDDIESSSGSRKVGLAISVGES